MACDDERLAEHTLEVVVFYTIALTLVDYSGIDEEYRRQVLGNVPGYRSSASFPGYLIAQLARDDRYGHEDVSGSDLLQQAEWVVFSASQTIGGRILYLDCKDEMTSYYEDRGYSQLYFDDETCLYKMFKSFGALDAHHS